MDHKKSNSTNVLDSKQAHPVGFLPNKKEGNHLPHLLSTLPRWTQDDKKSLAVSWPKSFFTFWKLLVMAFCILSWVANLMNLYSPRKHLSHWCKEKPKIYMSEPLHDFEKTHHQLFPAKWLSQHRARSRRGPTRRHRHPRQIQPSASALVPFNLGSSSSVSSFC